ncbi:retrovirus-related pol polyprotein from transposon TNT 1-94 [Tanacetum coccineum]
MSKVTSTKSWLWHRKLLPLNFGTINYLTRLDLVDGLPKFKYGKDHLCSTCKIGKSKKASHPLKIVLSDHSKLELLHMDLCGPMRVASINGKKYILVIVDDYSRYTWVYFLHSKDETLEIIKKFIAQAQLNYKAKVCKIRTDNEFPPSTTLKTHIWTKSLILLDHVIGDPSKIVHDSPRLHTQIIRKEFIALQLALEETSVMLIILVGSKHTRLVAKGLQADECVSISTPMATERLDADLQGTPTDQTTYRRMIGGLMYLTASRPDIAFATFVCARYQARPTVKHLKEVKRIFRYLRQSYNMGLWYPKDSGFELIAYSDADHAGCKDDCKSTSGGLQFLGGKLVSWSSKKQDCTAMSTAEAEYVSLSACCAQVIWMRTQLLDYGYKYNRILMYCDSKSAIAISCNPVQHSKTKHIDIRYHFIKEHVEKVIIMAQQQHATDVHPDELCPPNKRYDLMGSYNKKVDLEHVQCPPESKIMTNIIKNHPLRFSIAASSSVPWIYMTQFWHTLKEDGWDQPPLQIMQMMYCFVNNIYVDYAELLWEGIYYSLHHPTSSILHKDKVGMQIPDWMITEEMKHTEHYMMYVEDTTESSAPKRSTVIHFRLPERRSTRLTPPVLVPTVEKADEMILQDTLQVSLVEHKSQEEQEARENVELVNKHLASEEIEKLVPQTTCRPSTVHPRDQDDPHDDARPEGENSAKRQKTSDYEAYVFGESSSGQVNEEERGPSTSGNQEQEDDYDFWIDSYASDDDEIYNDKCHKINKRNEEFLQSDIVWESRKEILVSPHPRKTTPLVQRDPEAPALSLINQDLLYLKKGSLGPEKIIIVIHSFPCISSLMDDDIEFALHDRE